MVLDTVESAWKIFGEADPVWGAIFGLLSVVVSGIFMLINKRIDARTDEVTNDRRAQEMHSKSEKALRNDMLQYAQTLHEDFDNMRKELQRMQERAEEAERKLEEAQADLKRANERIEYLEECQCYGRC